MSARRENPETGITRQIRDLLRLMSVPHIKHFGGPLSERGVSDIIGTLPGRKLQPVLSEDDAMALAGKIAKVGPNQDLSLGQALIILALRVVELEARGRAFFCEVKSGKNMPSEEQLKFLSRMRAAGAVAFSAWGSADVVRELSHAGFDPAKRISVQFGPGSSIAPDRPGGAASAAGSTIPGTMAPEPQQAPGEAPGAKSAGAVPTAKPRVGIKHLDS